MVRAPQFPRGVTANWTPDISAAQAIPRVRSLALCLLLGVSTRVAVPNLHSQPNDLAGRLETLLGESGVRREMFVIVDAD